VTAAVPVRVFRGSRRGHREGERGEERHPGAH
jgi:hypothetical protein